MKNNFLKTLTIAVGAALISLTACTNVETPETVVEAVQPSNSLNTQNRAHDDANTIISDYYQYQDVLKAIARDDDLAPAQFLAQQRTDNAMAERVRNNWLKRLGRRGNWAQFQQQYPLLSKSGIDQETQCFAETAQLNHASAQNQLAKELMNDKAGFTTGCNRLIAQAASLNQFKEQAVWERVRLLLSKNQVTDARRLASAINQPLPSNLAGSSMGGQANQEAALYAATAPKNRNNILGQLSNIKSGLSQNQIAFAYGLAGLSESKKQNLQVALNYFMQSDPNQLDEEQWQWYARAALRQQNWAQLKNIILQMPTKVQADETWQYWLARSYQALGNQTQAKKHFQQAENSGRNFYALLATEALGNKVNTTSNAPKANTHALQSIQKDGAITRALTLFKKSQEIGDWTMRREAQAQWRYAVRDYNETTLIASAEVANQHSFNEMTIYSADRTNNLLNYPLRYLSPFREITERYAPQANVDPAWVYGLIRQESRFMLSANSHVGATGLMQIMPATGREIARKIGLTNYSLTNIDNNIQMGTWYLGDIRNSLGSEVLATAGYNAGPSRARRWQANTPLEGAIYAETIPFNETRDYVKKVMANATYYASLFNEPQTSLTQRMGTIPAK